jgi:TonB-dependent SusC/RagA subfamily outer membrane receptor
MKKKLLFLFLTFILICHLAMAKKIISGTVTAADKVSPLAGVAVLVENSNLETVTDRAGNFVIEVEKENANLAFNLEGYKRRFVKVGSESVINVNLDSSLPGEGSGDGQDTCSNMFVTSSSGNVKADFSRTSYYRVEQLLQGQVPGLYVTQNSGAPGSDYSINIRGVGSNFNASPVIFVDGIRTEAIEFLDPNDIASIEIQKDAAATGIHGIEGGNGVIWITTRNGSGSGKKVQYNFTYGTQRYSTDAEMMNDQQYYTYIHEALLGEVANANALPVTDPFVVSQVDSMFPYAQGSLPANTRWLDEIFEPAPMQKHHISVAGGNESSDYYISGNYYKQEGVIGGSKSSYQRIAVRLNTNTQLKKWLKVGNKFAFSQNTREILPENSEKSGIVASAMRMDPLTPVYLSGTPDLNDAILARLTTGENDQYYGISENLRDNGYFNIANPLARIVNSHTNYLENKIHGNVYGQLEITEGLLLTEKLNVDATYRYWKNWEPNFYYSSFNNLSTSYVEARMDNFFNFSWDNLLSYQKSFEDHHILAMAGYSVKLLKWRYTYGSRQGLQLMQDNYAHLSSTTIDLPGTKFIGGDYYNIKIGSLYGMFNYNYKSKYIASLSLRSDSPTDSVGYEGSHLFYSAGLGWVVSEEAFWPVPLINSFKIRANLGTAGGHNPYNPLESEKVQMINAGFDMGLKDNLVNFSFDYFDNTSSALNLYTTVDTVTGWFDIGKVKNSGMEFSLGLNNDKGDFKYSVTLIATYLKNEVTELNPDLGPIYGTQVSDTNVVTMISEGYPIWHFCGYETNGVFQNQGEIDSYVNGNGQLLQPTAIPGDLRFVDSNGDGVIDMNDMADIGKPYPDWIYGLNINLEYKGIDLGIGLQGAKGFEIYNAIKGSNVNFSNRYVSFYEDRWTQANHTNNWFRPLASDRNVNTRPSALFIEDGSYIKLRQVTIGYTLPGDLMKKAHIGSLRLFVTLDNILTITDYSGLDPEVGYSSNLPGSFGVDRGIYPLASSILFGINLGL